MFKKIKSGHPGDPAVSARPRRSFRDTFRPNLPLSQPP